jgi:hypothetical protein
MKIRNQLLNRSAQEVICSLPSLIAIDGEHCRHNIVGLPKDAPAVIIVKPGERGYYAPPYAIGKSLDEVDALHERVFDARKPSEAEREAASIGSMVGWGVPGADPLNYEEA